MFHVSVPKTTITWLTILLIISFIASSGRVTAQTLPCFAWVQDHNILDSQFGVYDGTSAQYLGGIYPGFDIEGLAFINGVLYAASGGDGRVPSKLFTVTLDVAHNSSAFQALGPIQTDDGAPYYEVSSLAGGSPT
ncbi:MAG: hypothetical protein NT075_29690 [Chloroflexi bacterium]|nr:hypothetical protein [Chloroflexota bacterium]